MDHIDETLAQMGLNEDFLPAVRAAASLGRKTCNRFYSKMDDTEMNRIVMGMSIPHAPVYSSTDLPSALHPSWKFDYFREVGWENSWIRDVKAMLRAEYDRKYADYPIAEEEDPEDASSAAAEDAPVKVRCHSCTVRLC